MQPLKLTILGDFWDSQIYRGRLYLWKMDGSLKVIKWDDFIDHLTNERSVHKLALMCGFSRGDYLYGYDFSIIFSEANIKDILFEKFNSAAELNLVFEEHELDNFVYGEQNNPFSELPTDSEIFNSNIYAIIDNSLFKTTAHRNDKKNPVMTRPDKIWDCPLLSLKVSKYGNLALSGGSEGLFEYEITDSPSINVLNNVLKIENNIFRLSEKNSLFSDWTYSSIYSSSKINDSYMALFKVVDNFEYHALNPLDHTVMENPRKLNRIFQREVSEEDIFRDREENSISWGSGDKIYRANTNHIDFVRFSQFKKENESYFSEKERIDLAAWKGEIIFAGSAYYGSIVECENALVVLRSDNDFTNIIGPVTRWRVFPRSIRYENHLHVITEDKLEIFSFNHDYFLNQYEKVLGVLYLENKKKFKYK